MAKEYKDMLVEIDNFKANIGKSDELIGALNTLIKRIELAEENSKNIFGDFADNIAKGKFNISNEINMFKEKSMDVINFQKESLVDFISKIDCEMTKEYRNISNNIYSEFSDKSSELLEQLNLKQNNLLDTLENKLSNLNDDIILLNDSLENNKEIYLNNLNEQRKHHNNTLKVHEEKITKIFEEINLKMVDKTNLFFKDMDHNIKSLKNVFIELLETTNENTTKLLDFYNNTQEKYENKKIRLFYLIIFLLISIIVLMFILK